MEESTVNRIFELLGRVYKEKPFEIQPTEAMLAAHIQCATDNRTIDYVDELVSELATSCAKRGEVPESIMRLVVMLKMIDEFNYHLDMNNASELALFGQHEPDIVGLDSTEWATIN